MTVLLVCVQDFHIPHNVLILTNSSESENNSFSVSRSVNAGSSTMRGPKRRFQRNSSDSETEDELAHPLPSSPVNKRATLVPSTSGTDTEEEDESQRVRPLMPFSTTSNLQPRPAFKPTPEQEMKPLFVLDDQAGIRVPRSISMYLRTYQEEGVKFFWDRYKEGRGGILGDDMGL